MGFLEGAFLIRMLWPFAPSGHKRKFKRPKFYWRDSGLLHSLLNVSSMEDLHVNLQAGRSWEGYVIEQILGALDATGRSPDPFFWHSSYDAREIDLVLDFVREKWAVKTIHSANPDPSFFASLDAGADIIGAKRRFLVSQTEEVVDVGDKVLCNLPWLASKIMAKEI